MQSASSPEVIAVGHLCYDNICLVDGYPPEDTSRHIEEVLNQPGGTASQAIAAFTRLGGKAGYLGVLGDDMAGRYLLSDLQQEGIDHRHVRIVPGERSSFSFVVSNRLNASRTLFSYHDRLPPIDFASPHIRAYIGAARCVHLDGTMYENALGAARVARAQNVLVSLDGCSMQKDNAKNWALARLADVLVMNETYPLRLTGIDDPERALLEIARAGPRIVLSTRGAKGCLLVQDGQVVSYPAFSIAPVDTTGAGDAFHGGFLYGLLKGLSLPKTIRLASAVAAINCGFVGGRQGLPRREAVETFLREHPFADPETTKKEV